MNANLLKFLAGAGTLAMWFALVVLKLTDPAPLVAALGGVLAAVLGYHAITNLSGTGQVAAIIQQLIPAPPAPKSALTGLPTIQPAAGPTVQS
jgi:hypothetical protein